MRVEPHFTNHDDDNDNDRRGLGVGKPDGTECSTTTTVNVSTQTATPHLTGTYAPGVYCVRVFDVGNLFSTASFVVSIAHS